MDRIKVIAKNVYKTNVRSWSFLGLVLGPILLVIITSLITWSFNNDIQNNYGRVNYITSDTELKDSLERLNTQNDIIVTSNIKKAQQDLIEEKIDMIVEVIEDENNTRLNIYVKSDSENINIDLENNLIKNYQIYKYGHENDISSNQIQGLVNQTFDKKLIKLNLDKDGNIVNDSNNENFRLSIAFIFNALLFFYVMYYMQIIAKELGKEKGTKIIEVIITSMKPEHHLYGKLIGVSFLFLTHLIIYLALLTIFLVSNKFFDWSSLHINVYDMNFYNIIKNYWPIIFSSLLFSLLGIVIYTSLTAFIASLANNTEDAQSIDLPLRVLMIIGFYIGLLSIYNFDSVYIKVASFVPFWTPFIMPIRLATNTVATLEILLAILLCSLFVILSLYIATVFYKTNLLTYSDKGLRSSLKKSFFILNNEHKK